MEITASFADKMTFEISSLLSHPIDQTELIKMLNLFIKEERACMSKGAFLYGGILQEDTLLESKVALDS